MLNERVKELLEYLNVLSQVQGSGHYVNEEIKEVVKEIRLELGLEKRKQETLKESRRLVFEAKLGRRATFRQMTLFEAVFGFYRGTVAVPYFDMERKEMKEALKILHGMNKEVEVVEKANIIEVRR
ncbi:hypothetical protein ABES03_08690 [Neobacillus rhizosphaerae]|uniref:hypothetical protein n=1 Tax=Neobacillus rhizosphaerae TaxID=2880965 RepID=UPI003D27A300